MTSLPAGRDLDALVAEKVMGIQGPDFKCEECAQFTVHLGSHPPEYSTDMAAAWTVVEKVGSLHEFALIGAGSEGAPIWEAGWYETGGDGPESEIIAFAATAPLAMCLAALRTIDA